MGYKGDGCCWLGCLLVGGRDFASFVGRITTSLRRDKGLKATRICEDDLGTVLIFRRSRDIRFQRVAPR